jgi:hypothetical protein
MSKHTPDIERLAALEHERWAKWQNYLHSFLTWNNDIQAWVLQHEWKDRWQMQINTPYAMLSEKEKESDREQVRPYLKLLQSQAEEYEREKMEMAKELFKVLEDLNTDRELNAGQHERMGIKLALQEFKFKVAQKYGVDTQSQTGS